MGNEKVDPWALLREARGHVFNWPDYTVNQKRSLLDRIDAALAAHDAVLACEKKVEWRNTPDGEDAVINNVVLSVWGWRGGWAWQSKPLAEPSYLNRTEMGLSNTLDEAKSAAIAAARGMR